MNASKSKMNSNFKVERLVQVNHAMTELHYHDFYEIYIQDQGERDHLVSNVSYTLSPKHILLFKPNTLHQSISSSSHTRTIVYFTRELLSYYYTDSMIEQLLTCFTSHHLSLNDEQYYKVSNLVRKLSKEDAFSSYNFVSITLGELLLSLSKIYELNNLHMKNPIVSLSPTPTTSPYVKESPLITYIHENYLALNHIDDIAKTFFITKSHLCRTFKKLTGVTIISYINHLKIDKSCMLIQEDKKPIHEISYECGFNSVIYFNRVFKDRIGISPSTYRAQFMKDNV